MSDVTNYSDGESNGEKDENFNVEDYQDDIESDESFKELMKNGESENNSDEEVNSSAESDRKHNGEYIGPILPGGHRFDKKLVCIRYPGNVVNPEKAIETLGGLTDITETVNTKNRRLELRFRPDDGYCKPTCGDKHHTAGFLLRIRIKKSRRERVEKSSLQENEKQQKQQSLNTNDKNYSNNKNNSKSISNTKDIYVNKLSDKIETCSVKNKSESKGDDPDNVAERLKSPTFDRFKYDNLSEDVEYELPKLKVLGRVDSEFRFTNLCDFQYLPITKNKDDPTKDECVYDQIYPVGLPLYSWMKGDAPYFLPPAAFSRMDSVQQYAPKTETSSSDVRLVIGKTRKRRAGFSNFINFNAPYVPTSPPKGIETALRVKFLQTTHVEKMRKAFKDRPVWSKTALMYETKFSNEQLKILLPSVAYYFMTGPWRITWVRLGYDPRQDPEARRYQTLDYRLKAMHGLHSNITCKRNYSEYTLPYRSTCNSKAKTMVLMPNTDKLIIPKKQKMIDENVYIYRPGIIPPSRQMFYQYCDVHVDEIQDMINKCVAPSAGTPCHEKLGWLPVGFDDLCREIINKQVRVELRKIMNIPENHPTTLPRKRIINPFNMKRKRTVKKRKEKVKKITEKEKAQLQEVTVYDEDDPMQSEGDEWEDILDKNNLSNDKDNVNDNKDENES